MDDKKQTKSTEVTIVDGKKYQYTQIIEGTRSFRLKVEYMGITHELGKIFKSANDLMLPIESHELARKIISEYLKTH